MKVHIHLLCIIFVLLQSIIASILLVSLQPEGDHLNTFVLCYLKGRQRQMGHFQVNWYYVAQSFDVRLKPVEQSNDIVPVKQDRSKTWFKTVVKTLQDRKVKKEGV